MKIINAMFGRKLGGIEQACVDYARAMTGEGHKVLTLIHPRAAIRGQLHAHGLHYLTVHNLGEWDPFAVLRARRIFQTFRPELVLCHGNRAIGLLKKAAGRTPVVGVAHNYNIKRFAGLDGALAITQDLCNRLEETGLPGERIFHIPNMIDLGKAKYKPHSFHHPPVIGSMGRFVEKKGFPVFLEALNLLQQRDLPFTAVLAGVGEQEAALKQQAGQLQLQNRLRFPGWVTDKAAFFKSTDLFVLPSLHEPFGIVLLEAFAHSTPVISTESEGPREICEHESDSLLVPAGDATALADAMERFLREETLAQQLSEQAFEKVRNQYALPVVGRRISEALTDIASLSSGQTALHSAHG